MAAEIERRSPPDTVTREAKDIAAQGIAGRVKIEPDGNDGWRVVVDGTTNSSRGPPADIANDKWDSDGIPAVTKRGFDEIEEKIKEKSKNRKQITATHGRASAKGYWRVTINYDDPRKNDRNSN
jgi:hypothetical protein